MDANEIRFGDIVLADIPDEKGLPCQEPHPAMVFRGPDATGLVYLVGISTKYTPGERLVIELPWAEGGHPVTGLWKKCAIKCWWIKPFSASLIIKKLGAMPPDIPEMVTDYAVTAVMEKKRVLGKPTNP